MSSFFHVTVSPDWTWSWGGSKCICRITTVALGPGWAAAVKPISRRSSGPIREKRMLFSAQRLLEMLRVFEVSLEERSRAFERRLQLRVLGVWDQCLGSGVNHGLVIRNF